MCACDQNSQVITIFVLLLFFFFIEMFFFFSFNDDVNGRWCDRWSVQEKQRVIKRQINVSMKVNKQLCRRRYAKTYIYKQSMVDDNT